MEVKDGTVEFNAFVNSHRPQLEQSSIPSKFWLALYKKLDKGILDAGEAFVLYKIDYEGDKTDSDPLYTVLVSKEDGINCDDGLQIYLIDHAWTYINNRAVNDLIEFPNLLNRMCNLMGISDELTDEEKVSEVYKEMWKYNQTYSYGFGEPENQIPLWYIMDEFGSAIQHSKDPNFRAVPFYYIRDQISYTLLFPIKNVECREKVTRNYLEGLLGDDELTNKALLIPWEPTSLLDVDFCQSEPDEEYFLHGHVEETLPNSNNNNRNNINSFNNSRRLKVYSDYNIIAENLTDSNFEITYEENDADILWLNGHFKMYKELSENFPHKFINQFPFEHVLTVKDLLSIIIRRKKHVEGKQFADNPFWYPATFNLKTELAQFVSYFQHREKLKLDNHWICKPWNLARGLDIVITDNLNCLLRLTATGPKIAQKYIEKPLLFERSDVGLVKFDIRYVILLKSVEPLRVYAYKNFFLRFANKPFCMNNFWDAEMHFTVMNYNENFPLYKMLCSDFVLEFNRQNPDNNWKSVEECIFQVLREVMQAATMKSPPCGIAHYNNSRALYAVDLILSREESFNNKECITPKILEVNWNPDCKRACEYYPTFFNDIFLFLFKNKENENLFRLL